MSGGPKKPKTSNGAVFHPFTTLLGKLQCRSQKCCRILAQLSRRDLRERLRSSLASATVTFSRKHRALGFRLLELGARPICAVNHRADAGGRTRKCVATISDNNKYLNVYLFSVMDLEAEDEHTLKVTHNNNKKAAYQVRMAYALGFILNARTEGIQP